jgi:flagellar hook assembly protein FlgD
VEGNKFRSPVSTLTVAAMRMSVGPNFPNPFNPSTTIEYTTSTRMQIAIEILDVSGAVVTRLEQGILPGGKHQVTWNGRDTAGRPVGSGVYFYRLAGMSSVAAGKMILLK